MIVSVTEYREIVCAWSQKNCTINFFIETLLIGQMGGLIGIILGSIGFGIASAMDFVFVIPWTAILAAFLTSFMVAIISGLYLQLKPQT
jgi:putative ABC transport system permease protein